MSICIPIGIDIENRPTLLLLDTAPHVMIAGSSGSGKSTALHSIICQLLRAASPDTIRLILIDLKHVEFSAYDGIPHLAAPVADNATDAIRQLKGLLANQTERYRLFKRIGARNITEANQILSVEYPSAPLVPYIVVVADELAELMLESRKEVEPLLVRIAQLGRAAGIHMVLATQYPKSEVITGALRVNVPTKIAFAVPDQIASRVILDRVGAENLLGRGDGLLSFGGLPPTRFQAALCTQSDIQNIVERWRS